MSNKQKHNKKDEQSRGSSTSSVEEGSSSSSSEEGNTKITIDPADFDKIKKENELLKKLVAAAKGQLRDSNNFINDH